MSTTIVGVFNSRQQAEDALYTLRNQLEAQNVAIIVRDDETASKQMSTGIAGVSSEMSGSGQAGFANSMSTNLMGQLTQNAMELGGTAGQLAGRVAALAATAAFTLPVTMMGPMFQGMMGPMTIPTMANQMFSGMSPMNNTMTNNMNNNMRTQTSAMTGTFQSGTPQGANMVGGSGTMSQGETVVLTIYADENLNQAVDILRNHGAQEVNTYSGC